MLRHLLLIAAIASGPAAATEAVLDPERALQVLLRAQVFEDDAISFDGHESDGVRAFRVLFAQPDAAARFLRLSEQATLAGRLYGLIGLRHFDRAAFDGARRSLEHVADQRVDAQFGCSGLSLRVGELVQSTRRDAVRLEAGETLDAWLRVHKTGELDIVGGGYTAKFGRVASIG